MYGRKPLRIRISCPAARAASISARKPTRPACPTGSPSWVSEGEGAGASQAACRSASGERSV